MDTLDRAIGDYAARMFLRYFRRGTLAGVDRPHVDLARDIDLLRAHWALSEPVRTFLSYVLTHRHEAQSLLQFVTRSDDAVARGRIDARGTILARRMIGHPSLVIYEEPMRSFNTGPNQVVAWVVHTAAIYAARLSALQPVGSSYTRLVEDTMADVTAVMRLDAFREVFKSVAVHRRPGPGALRDAARSRRTIYRLAISAYATLTKVEAGEETALLSVLQSTLIGPLEQWRRFELAVGLGIGEALSAETGENMSLALLGKTAETPIISCGRYHIFWQGGGGLFSQPALEPSEERLEAVLAAYGMRIAADRPDLIITDRLAGRAVGIVEVKYLSGDTTSARFREAAGQIVRYARGYSSETQIDGLVRASLIVLSREAPALLDENAPAPRVLDFAGLSNGKLQSWLQERLLIPPA
ncbi:hypothetical protein [Rhodovulum viride]|uniref:hypothetical protein n=1 Tax=Rhodovulum viride TaxID=1231134 RepID=UPI0011BDC0F1|nr:hypothetical protein [Rhodovulum viride]